MELTKGMLLARTEMLELKNYLRLIVMSAREDIDMLQCARMSEY